MTDTPRSDDPGGPVDPAAIEARLRAALAARAGGVEPAPGTEAAAVEAMAAARRGAARRRMVLAVAAAVVVVAAVAGAFLLAGGDDDDLDVATGGTTTSTAPVATEPPSPAIWPLPTMSVAYETPSQAARTFMREFAGIGRAECVLVGPTGMVDDAPDGTASVPCGLPCPVTTCDGSETSVEVHRTDHGWVVLGATSSEVAVVTPEPGATVGADIEVSASLTGRPDFAGSAGPTLTAKVPALGQDPAAFPSVDTMTIPVGDDGTWRLVLGAADGPTVLLVTTPTSVTAHVFTVDSASVPAETTTTTTGPTDDGTPGWPGPVARTFDTAEAAAQAFVTEVLGFADPALADLTEEGPDAIAVYHPRPTATASTSIAVHDTGPARGWVVTGTTSSQGSITDVLLEPTETVVHGEGTAFEAQVHVALLDVTGQVLVEGGALAGSNGERGPFEARLPVPPQGTTPAFALVAEGDASGEGTYTWAVVVAIAP